MLWSVIERIGLQVTLAQKKGQAIRIASRCLWDATNDTYASFVHENQSLICNCQVWMGPCSAVALHMLR